MTATEDQVVDNPPVRQWSPDQQAVIEGLESWLHAGDHNGDNQFITVGGYAGTGKTTIISHLICSIRGVAVAALCGKAAQVLRSKGVHATTIHSLIYRPYTDDRGKIKFKLRTELEDVDLIIVDEASMINVQLFSDLLSFELPIIFVGDHGQLEPIGDNPNLMAAPTLRLEKIHRQALDNPILRVAHEFRESGTTDYFTDPEGRLEVIPLRDFYGRVSPDVPAICGYNRTRHDVNKRARKLAKRKKAIEEGERIICLRNNRTFDIFNGQLMTVTRVRNCNRILMDLDAVTDDGRELDLQCFVPQFGVDLLKDFKGNDLALCDYGYAITAHKSQGSEFDDVLVCDEVAPSWDARRWRYTAATRAKAKLTYCM